MSHLRFASEPVRATATMRSLNSLRSRSMRFSTSRMQPPSGLNPMTMRAHCCRFSIGWRLIEIAFPKYRDGRGYSSARILREAGYTGELRAQGDVLVDQIAFMRRCGFDSFAPEAIVKPRSCRRCCALQRYDHVLPKAPRTPRFPVWKLRHG